jgi:hypothetical protein
MDRMHITPSSRGMPDVGRLADSNSKSFQAGKAADGFPLACASGPKQASTFVCVASSPGLTDPETHTTYSFLKSWGDILYCYVDAIAPSSLSLSPRQ